MKKLIPLLIFFAAFFCAEVLAQVSPAYNDPVFTEYFRRTSGWVASDATISVPTNDGKVIWLFGDTHIDNYNDADTSVHCLFQVRNSMMVQDKSNPSDFITILDNSQTGLDRTPVKLDDNHASFFWPGHGYAKGDTAIVFWQQYTGADISTIKHTGVFVSKIFTPGFTDAAGIKSLTKLPLPAEIEFGVSVVVDSADNYIYIYGHKQDWIVLRPLVARCAFDQDITGPWEFFNGSTWTPDINAAAQLMESTDHFVSPSYSVMKLKDKYYMVSQENGYLSCGLGREIYSWESDSPTGPFTNKKLVYTIEDKYKGEYLVTYNANAHPEFIENNELLISYNVNGFDSYSDTPCENECQNPFRDRRNADGYRPKFIRVPLSFIDPALADSTIHAHFSGSPMSGYAPLEVAFDASTTTVPSASDVSYHWDFADGNTGSGKTISHTYTEAGNYIAVLLVSDVQGNESTYATTIEVDSPIKVEYKLKLKDNKPNDELIQVNFKIHNTSSAPVPYNELTLRYWFTKEGKADMAFVCDYPAIAAGKVKGEFVAMEAPVGGADHYLEISFDDTRSIKAGAKTVGFQTRFFKTNGSRFKEINDYSYDPYRSVWSDWNNITLYRKGQLIWGIEPSAIGDSVSAKDRPYPYSLEVYPNPVAENEVEVNLSLETASFVLLSVHSLTGKVKLVKNLGYQTAGIFNQAVNIENLPKGVYLIQLRTKGKTYQSRLIRQ